MGFAFCDDISGWADGWRGGTERGKLGRVDHSFLLIGVGASAGGLAAIKSLVGDLPASTTHSFVIVQHLSPDYKSMMTEILGRETTLDVVEVRDDMPVEPGHVYLIPPKWNVVIQGTQLDPQRAATGDAINHEGLRFSLIQRGTAEKVNYPIDLFFQSLAEAARERAVGIVLSGTGTDGSHGIRAIKDNGGLVMAQSPGSADFDGMPNAAIDTQLVDIIVAPGEMMDELTRYFEDIGTDQDRGTTLIDQSDELFKQLIAQVSGQVDIDFTRYKQGTLKRRAARRINIARCQSLEDYLKLIDDDPDEIARLSQDFLVGTTTFFRDAPAWGDLESEVLPRIFSEGEISEPVKVWSLGCSTGEEAYTLALLFECYRQHAKIERDFKIIATDVNNRALEAARKGVFSSSALSTIPEKFLSPEFMTVNRTSIHISAALQRKIVFANHNAL